MGFLTALRGWSASHVKPDEASSSAQAKAPIDPNASATLLSDFDREQWLRKLKRLLAHLPGTEAEWVDLHQEAGSLGFPEEWVKQTSMQEFALLVRKIVADKVVTQDEHQKLDQARKLLGIPDERAVAIFHTIVAEAEAFFGMHVEGV
jgi:hypothetical protein